MKAEHVIDYLGKKWVSGAHGPDAFDCWGLLKDIYRRCGIELPSFAGVHEIGLKDVSRICEEQTAEGSSTWCEIETPEHLCCVAMGQKHRFNHVGVFLDLDGGLVLHSTEGRNVTAQDLPAIRRQGINRVSFYRHDKFKSSNPIFR